MRQTNKTEKPEQKGFTRSQTFCKNTSMNVEDNLLKEEQERTLTWAIENLEKQREGIKDRISNASGEFQDIKSRLDDIAAVIDDMTDEKDAVDKKIEVAMQRMANLNEEPVVENIPPTANPDVSVDNGTTIAPDFNAAAEDVKPGQYASLKVNCRANTLELVRQIALRTGVSEATIMENAVSAVAQAIQKNNFRMHFPLGVKLVNYDD